MNDHVRNLTCEMFGVFLLTFLGAGSILTTTWTGGSPGLVGIALAHGIALAIAVSAVMNLSGGHINPAVTITMLATGRIRIGQAVSYIVAQCLGAVIAGLCLSMIFSNLGPGAAGISGIQALNDCKLGTPNFGPAVGPGIAVFTEILLTFVLVFTVFGTAVDERTPRVAGFAIGLSVTVDILVGGPITGAAMNPARAFGTLLAGGGACADLWTQHWVYWIGPIGGALLAGFLYDGLILARLKR